MKTVKCDLCDETMDGETFEDWMKAAYAHYVATHPEVMQDTSKTKEDGEKWMADARARFDAA